MQLLWEGWRGTHEIHFADANPMAVAPMGPPWPLPRAGHPDYERAILTLCQTLRIDLVIPAVDEELPLMPLVRRGGFDVLLPDEWFVHIMLDKLSGFRELARRGAAVPRTVIAKPRVGRGSREVFVEQEELQGQEYTVQMMADRTGNLRHVVPVRVAHKRGITLRGQVDLHPLVITACETLHSILPGAGCYNIQGILTEDRGFLPFEINPRLSTTTGLALLCGYDPLAVWYGEPTDSPKRTATFQRTWQNTIQFI